MAILKESWHTLTKPSSITLKDGYDNATKSVIIMEPFARGFGNTLGNALRRVLLSSINGFAITSVKIEGVSHEYGTIEGVKEDVLDIIMNLKSLAIVKSDGNPFTIRLSSNKNGPVYAGSIELPAGVEIINRDLLICTLEKGAKIEMQMHVECGKGYVVASQDKKIDRPIGNIMVDAMFSPVKRVSYRVENARVGQITDYDKLIIEIDTNGTVTPQDALGVAAKILQEQLQVFINFDVAAIDAPVQVISIDEPEFNKNLLKTIDELELSVRSYNCLKNENIIYVGDLVSKSEAEMLKTANFGRKSLNELKDNLKIMGLTFGMKLTNWPPKNLDELLKLKNKEF
ncbi:DNA-directed RNA polymerase subunit alpha [Alphaproteobacteria bacterium]|nr:DNA-directed RNA polymerase subunit alpha [Alphaproteobacteria bacterium]